MKHKLKKYYLKVLVVFNSRFRRFNKLLNITSDILPKSYCFDVGASYYAHPKWKSFMKSHKTTWIAVEPNEENLGYTEKWGEKSKLLTVKTGLSRNGGKQILFKTNIDSGSSLLEPVINEDMIHRVDKELKNYLFPYEKLAIDTTSINSVFEKFNLDTVNPSLIKLDTQGTELDILKGVDSKIFESIICIEMENTFQVNPIMKGSSHFHETMKFLYHKGFELLYIKPIQSLATKKKKQFKPNFYINEADCIFTKKFSNLNTASLDIQLAMLGVFVSYNFFEELNSLAKIILKNNSRLNIKTLKALNDIIKLTD